MDNNKIFDIFGLDWSGTVSDDRRTVYEANMRILEDYNKPRLTFDNWLAETMSDVVEFAKKFGIRESPEKLKGLYLEYLTWAESNGHKPFAYDDAADVLRYLHNNGKKIVILSTHPEEKLARESERYGLSRFITETIGGSKNKAEDLRMIMASFSKSPNEVLYVGDTIFDIQAAKKAGVNSAGIINGYHSRKRLEEEEPDYILESLSDLKRLII